MLLTDILLMLSLVTFCVAWFAKPQQWRALVLLISAIVAVVSGVIGYLNWRWQAVPGLVVALLFLVVLLIGHLRKNTTPKIRTPWVSGILFALLSGFSAWIICLFPVPDLPDPGGRYAVGVRDFELVDTSRSGLMEAADDELRKLKIRVWYPAADVDGLEARPYFTEQETRDTARSVSSNIGLPSFLFTYLSNVRTNSYENAPALQGETLWPVVFYSHGYTSHFAQNTALMERLASNGYMVYSVHHSYDAATIRFDDGTTASMGPEYMEYAKKMQEEGVPENMLKQFTGATYDERYKGVLGQYQDSIDNDERLGCSVPIWRDDRLFVLDSVASGQVPEAVRELARHGDYSRVGQMGMSFGGSTSGSVCQVDTRCAAAVNLDGGNFDPTLVNRDQPAPFLMMHSDWVTGFAAMLPEGAKIDPGFGFNDFAYERHETAGLNKDVYRLRVKDSTHLGYSDMGMMVRQPVRGLLFGDIDGAEMVAIQNDVVQDFFDKYLRGIDNNFPTGAYTAHPAIIPHSAEKVRAWWQDKESQ